jgi:ubiquinone/menaquinone biosynthesis C-methylase UbiE
MQHEAEERHLGEPLPNPIDVARLGEIYSRTAAFYDGIVANYQGPAKLAAIELLARQPDESFLEIGVGTAWAFERLTAATGSDHAYGLDVAEGMLAVARQRLNTEAAAHLLLADGRAMPFPAATFDCLFVTYTFEVLAAREIDALADECHRILRRGGRLVAVNLTEGENTDAAMTDDWKRRYASDPEFFGGARPLQLLSTLRARGFDRITRSYIGGDWPSELLLAYRP